MVAILVSILFAVSAIAFNWVPKLLSPQYGGRVDQEKLVAHAVPTLGPYAGTPGEYNIVPRDLSIEERITIAKSCFKSCDGDASTSNRGGYCFDQCVTVSINALPPP